MSEGQSFEKQHEITLQPSVDLRSVLEKGEIESAELLKGHFPIKVTQLKDDGKALFKPTCENKSPGSREFLRADLELLAAQIDKILGFGLVPPVVARSIENEDGVLQSFVEDAKTAVSLGEDWVDLVNKDELVNAAVFDYLIGKPERHRANFLINPKTGKIWLIDHDYLSLIGGGLTVQFILWAALKDGPIKLSDGIKGKLRALLAKIGSLQEREKPDIKQLLDSIRGRTQKLIETGILA